MQSDDDVKRMLEAAASGPSGPLDTRALLKKGARLRRARLGAAATGLAVVVAGASASFGILDARPDPGPAGDPAAECAGPGTTVRLYLRDDATRAEVTEIARRLERSPDVARMEYVSKDEAFEEFQRLYEGDPDSLAAPPDSLPASFRVEALDPAALERIVDADWPGTDGAGFAPFEDLACVLRDYCRLPVQWKMSAFLRDDATQAEVRALKDTLRQSGDASKVRYVSKRAAYRELEKLYADEPELVESVPAGALPASIRITASDEPAFRRLEAFVPGFPGVEDVKSSFGTQEEFCAGVPTGG